MNQDTTPARPLMVRLFVDYNPFYLLSAMCMLAGLFALNDSLDWSPLPEANLLWLILILNVYEFLLIGLGMFLGHRGLWRDAATLFVLEAFFLVDAGFLNAEIFALDFQLGMGINVALFVLAIVKVAMVFRGLRLPLSEGRYPLILLQIMILLAIPGYFKATAQSYDGDLPALAMYGAWWIVGIIPIIYLVLHSERRAYWHRGIVGVFVILPAISILAHICTSNWIYNVRWYSANLSPLLLGLAVAAGVCDWHARNLSARMRVQLLLPIVALLLASPYNTSLIFSGTGMILTPLRLTLVAAAMVYFHGLMVHRHPYFGIAGLLCLGAAGLGENPGVITRNLTDAGKTSGSAIWRILPRTVGAWGLVSVVASFVLLGLGAAVSLLRGTHKPATESAADGNDLT